MDLYEDKLITIALPEKPAAKGHAVVRAQQRLEALSGSDTAHLLSAASFIANALFEQVGAHGTNIILTDLEGARAEVIARTEDDGLSFQWQPLRLGQEEMDSIAARIRDRCDFIGHEEVVDEAPEQPLPKEREREDKQDSVKNYLLRQLDRIP